MRFHRHNIYRHKNCLDVDIRILNEQYAGREYSVVKLEYIAQRNPDFVFQKETVRIYRKNHKDWKLVLSN